MIRLRRNNLKPFLGLLHFLKLLALIISYQIVNEFIDVALQKLWRSGAVVAGDRIIVTMGDQTGRSGGTNSLRLIRLDSEGGAETETKLDLG